MEAAGTRLGLIRGDGDADSGENCHYNDCFVHER